MTLSVRLSFFSMVKLAPSAYRKNPQGAAPIVETLPYPIVTFIGKLKKNKKAILFSSNNDNVYCSVID